MLRTDNLGSLYELHEEREKKKTLTRENMAECYIINNL